MEYTCFGCFAGVNEKTRSGPALCRGSRPGLYAVALIVALLVFYVARIVTIFRYAARGQLSTFELRSPDALGRTCVHRPVFCDNCFPSRQKPICGPTFMVFCATVVWCVAHSIRVTLQAPVFFVGFFRNDRSGSYTAKNPIAGTGCFAQWGFSAVVSLPGFESFVL